MFRNRALCIPGILNLIIVLLFPLIPASLISIVNRHRVRKISNKKEQ